MATHQLTIPDLASAQFKANPYPFYARLRAEAPVYRTMLPSRQVGWLVTRYEDVLMVLRDERFVKDRLSATTPEQRAEMPRIPGLVKMLDGGMQDRNMLDLDGHDHMRLRGLVHKAFTPRLVERLRVRIQSLCNDLLTATRPRGSIELVRGYALPLPVTIIAEMLGVPPKDQRKFRSWSNSLASGSNMLAALPPMWFLMRYLRVLFEQRRASPQDDLVSALVQAEEAGDTLSEEELLSVVFMLIIAGHETTVNLIASGTLALLQHPDQLELLRRNPALIKPAIEELLRYTSPVDIATERYAREDVVISGVTIPRGEIVMGMLGSANRDEQQFVDPDTLDITREPNRHLTFGQGAHFCMGAPLARLEAQIAVATLLQRMPNLRLARSPESLRWRKGMFLRGLERLPLACS